MEIGMNHQHKHKQEQEQKVYEDNRNGNCEGDGSNNDDDDDSSKVLKVLEALKQASETLQTSKNLTSPSSVSSIKALRLLSSEPQLYSSDPSLSSHLHRLHSLLLSHPNRRPVSDAAASVHADLQAWIYRETASALVSALSSDQTAVKLRLLAALESRVSAGFDRSLQESILHSRAFESLEAALSDAAQPLPVRESAASVLAALVRFNKDVFVGEILMGRSVRALSAMACSGSTSALEALRFLVRSIKSPLVDDLQSNGEIVGFIGLLSSNEVEIRILAMELVMEIGYLGRKEAVEEMLERGVVKRLMELQSSDCGGSLIENGECMKESDGGGNVLGVEKRGSRSEEKRWVERHPFASCVGRFAIMLEVGEGLRQREKRAFKQEVLKRVREAALSEAEAATVLAEVLWGSFSII